MSCTFDRSPTISCIPQSLTSLTFCFEGSRILQPELMRELRRRGRVDLIVRVEIQDFMICWEGRHIVVHTRSTRDTREQTPVVFSGWIGPHKSKTQLMEGYVQLHDMDKKPKHAHLKVRRKRKRSSLMIKDYFSNCDCQVSYRHILNIDVPSITWGMGQAWLCQ